MCRYASQATQKEEWKDMLIIPSSVKQDMSQSLMISNLWPRLKSKEQTDKINTDKTNPEDRANIQENLLLYRQINLTITEAKNLN